MAYDLAAAVLAFSGAAAVVTDIRRRRIPNWLTGPAFLALLALNGWGAGRLPLAPLTHSALVFLTFAVPAAIGLVGWGDAKLAAALAAAGDARYVLAFCLWTAVASGAMAAGYTVARTWRAASVQALTGDWAAAIRSLGGPIRDPIPYGPAIVAGAWLAAAIPGLGW